MKTCRLRNESDGWRRKFMYAFFFNYIHFFYSCKIEIALSFFRNFNTRKWLSVSTLLKWRRRWTKQRKGEKKLKRKERRRPRRRLGTDSNWRKKYIAERRILFGRGPTATRKKRFGTAEERVEGTSRGGQIILIDNLESFSLFVSVQKRIDPTESRVQNDAIVEGACRFWG